MVESNTNPNWGGPVARGDAPPRAPETSTPEKWTAPRRVLLSSATSAGLLWIADVASGAWHGLDTERLLALCGPGHMPGSLSEWDAGLPSSTRAVLVAARAALAPGREGLEYAVRDGRGSAHCVREHLVPWSGSSTDAPRSALVAQVVSEREHAGEEARRAGRLEGVQSLAIHVADRLASLGTFLLAYLDLARSAAEGSPTAASFLERGRVAAEDISDLAVWTSHLGGMRSTLLRDIGLGETVAAWHATLPPHQSLRVRLGRGCGLPGLRVYAQPLLLYDLLNGLAGESLDAVAPDTPIHVELQTLRMADTRERLREGIRGGTYGRVESEHTASVLIRLVPGGGAGALDLRDQLVSELRVGGRTPPSRRARLAGCWAAASALNATLHRRQLDGALELLLPAVDPELAL